MSEMFDTEEMVGDYWSKLNKEKTMKKESKYKNWYYKYRMKIVMACLSDMVEKELDAVIDEIFEDGVEYGRETYGEHEHDECRDNIFSPYDLD